MSLFRIEFHDGRTFYNLVTMICKVTGSCQLMLSRDSMKIESFNGLQTVAIRVWFNMDYIKDYFLNEEYESYVINFKSNSLPSKGSMKRNDTLILSQDLEGKDIRVRVLSDSRTNEGGNSIFYNKEHPDIDQIQLPDEEEFSRCKMKVDRLSDIFKHSGVGGTCKTIFTFYKEGLKIEMKDSERKTVWSSGESYSGFFQTVEVKKNIIAEFAKLNTLHNESMCMITAYAGGGLLRIKLPVGCYATLEIYLMEDIKDDEEE